MRRPTPYCCSWCRWTFYLLLTFCVCGCNRSETLHPGYGKRRGPEGQGVNGTRLLASLFEANGFQVATTSRLSRSVDKADVVIWAPDSFQLPDTEIIGYFDEWLAAESGRTLVYIARDFDARIPYWQDVVASSPPEKQAEYLRQLGGTWAGYEQMRTAGTDSFTSTGLPLVQSSKWLTLRRDHPWRRVERLLGPWSDGIDTAKTDLYLRATIEPPDKHAEGQADDEEGSTEEEEDDDNDDEFMTSQPYGLLQSEVLLATADDLPLAFALRRDFQWDRSQILVVANGSWLLNYPLLNGEHRKLAVHLVNACGSSGRAVVLESNNRLSISNGASYGVWDYFTIEAFQAVLMHLTFLGILFCLSAFPIFGRPRTVAQDEVSRFSYHIVAVGKHLLKTQDREFARMRRETYLQYTRRESGASHLKRSAPDTPEKKPLELKK
ncbi:MAG: hypothetical protein KDA60_00665 [Planctomycetales bacterium]|nr:hypothetical protein [Planctomycetales bacterium]